MSYEDLKFTELMDSTFRKDSFGVWMAPVPFKSERTRLPNNRPQVLQRAQQLESNLKRNPEKLNHFIIFMDKVFRSQAAERAPVQQDDGIYQFLGKDECAITADIEQMFYRFFVIPEHRDFLRFFWFEDNDPNSPMVEYHDALKSTTLPEAAVSLLERTKRVLQNEGHIRLHKIASNNKSVMSQFSKEDLGKDLKDLDLSDDALPLHQSLGLSWDLNTDNFVFTATNLNSSFTRRGLLSAVSSIFDPIGFLAPFTVNGRMLLRETCPQGFDWDDQLPETHQKRWQNWMDDLNLLDGFQIPRMYVPCSYSQMKVGEVAIFSDASEKAVAAAAYLKTMDDQGQQHLEFIIGKSKLAPSAGNSIPRLELCGAVLATEIGQFLAEQLEIPLTEMRYFVDSRVVFGYIKNDTRRFYTYVSNRVARIRHITSPEQWNYVPTHLNPADVATRGVSQDILTDIQTWLKGPEYGTS
ncbi:uncharacterized protein LOC134264383 [Saccostrea cucullata]|uniref:uncharacterized protein LOC134264383 n=1 Tax=Saccostrea cuccullata TaxID=36930 RepID=UPI002ED11098